jgi:hypothetical protein
MIFFDGAMDTVSCWYGCTLYNLHDKEGPIPWGFIAIFPIVIDDFRCRDIEESPV